MPIRFTPQGLLDIATDPADLPEQTEGKVSVSGAMIRCKNLRLDRMGIASTRYGASKVNASAVDQTPPHFLIVQGGNRYLFAGTKIYKNETEIEDGMTSAIWSGVLYNPYNVSTQAIFALNGTDSLKIEDETIYNWGIAEPEEAPTIEEGASSGLTGDYLARYTYCRKVDDVVVCESNPSPVPDTAVALTDGSLKITIPASDDPQVTHARIYRTITDGTIYLHDQDISYEYAPNYIDSDTEDDSLGSAVSFNHNQPPAGTRVFGPNFGGQLFILMDNLLYFSLPNQGEYWPASYYLEVSPVQYPLMSGCFMGGQLFVASGIEIYTISGSGAASYFSSPNSAQCGTLAPDCFEPIRGYGIAHLGYDGIYMFSLTKDEKISQAIDPIFHGDTIEGLPPINKTYIANCWFRAWNNKLYFAYPTTTAYPDTIIRMDLGTQRIEHYAYGFDFPCIAKDETNKRLLAADTDGYVWEIEDEDVIDDGGTDITYDLETKHFNQLRKYFPRYARYDVAVGTGASCTGYIKLNGINKQTHSVNGDRLTRKRLIGGYTGDQLSVRITGTGPVDIYGLEVE